MSKHIYIYQDRSLSENVNLQIIDKIYNIVKKYNATQDNIDATSDIKGEISISYIWKNIETTIREKFNNLYFNIIDYYLSFNDPLVENKIVNTYGDGIGITETQVKEIVSFSDGMFIDINITNFDELSEFIGLSILGYQCFKNCTGVKQLIFPKIKNITPRTNNNGMFYGCEDLEYLDISSFAPTLGNEMFKNCFSLKTIILPTGISRLPRDVFYKCRKLETIQCNLSTITTIDQSAFGWSLGESAAPPRLIFSSCTSFGIEAFTGCGCLELSLPSYNGVIKPVNINYDSATFSKMPNVKKITFGHVTSVTGGRDWGDGWRRLFGTCPSLKVVDFGDSVTYYNPYKAMRDGTDAVSALIFRVLTPPETELTSMSDLCGSNRPWIFVPDAAVDTWKNNESWAFAADYIKPLSEYNESNYITWPEDVEENE